jgi:protein-S-isoprenylcysteine O-methyltransferase Ste14
MMSAASLMSSKRTTWVLQFVGFCTYLLGLPTMVVWLSGNWRWVEGWTFGVSFSGLAATTLSWLYYKHPALLAERFRRPGTGGESREDLVILIGVKVAAIAWIILPPLDVRFGWTPRLPLWSEVSGPLLFLVGSFFFFRAFTDNPFLSQLVRIQAERGQHVIDTGVYSVVRHPMYLGASLILVGGALLLGSVCGLLSALATILLLVIRIFGEEKLLARDLAGYQAYCERVRYRLVPWGW